MIPAAVPSLIEQLHERFPGLEPALLAEMAETGKLVVADVTDPVLRPGQFIRHNVLLLDGLLKIFREGDDATEYFLYYLEPGHACATSMLPVARNAEASHIAARAVQPSRVLLIPTYQSEQWITRYRTWNQFVIETYRARFEELLLTLDNVAFRALDERLAFYLKRHAQVQGPHLQLSHQQIADELNSSREVISRLLKKLEQRGAVVLHRSHIEVTNPSKLMP